MHFLKKSDRNLKMVQLKIKYCTIFSILLIFLFSCASSSPQRPYRLAICSLFKNEAPWLKEWILYHHKVLGVEHFYLYNNDSTDHYQEILQPFIDQGIVELIDWNSADPTHLDPRYQTKNNAPQDPFQVAAFNDCLKNKAFGKVKWLAVIDIDEFIVSTKGVNHFYQLLDAAEKRKRGPLASIGKSLEHRM